LGKAVSHPPRKVWQIEESARFDLDCDPTENAAKVDLELPVALLALRAA
jgi:hypothetical protein